MKYCAACGAEIPEHASFCSECGAEVEARPEDNNSDASRTETETETWRSWAWGFTEQKSKRNLLVGLLYVISWPISIPLLLVSYWRSSSPGYKLSQTFNRFPGVDPTNRTRRNVLVGTGYVLAAIFGLGAIGGTTDDSEDAGLDSGSNGDGTEADSGSDGTETDSGSDGSETDSQAEESGSGPIESVTGSRTTYQYDSKNSGQTRSASLPSEPEVAWSYDTEAEHVSSPVVADSNVYASDSSGTVFSLDAATGEENWTVSSAGTDSSTFPLVDDETLYISGEESLVAIAVSDGSVRWEAGVTGSAPKKQGDYIYIAGSDVAAVNANDGSIHWKNEDVFSVRQQPPAISDTSVFVCTHESLFALDANRGTIEWEFQGGFGDDISDLTSPTVHDGNVYIAAQDGVPEKLYAVDVATGEDVYSQTLGDRRAVPVGSVAISGSHLVGVEEHGTVFSTPMDRRGGWHHDLGIDATAASPPIVVGSDILLTVTTGTYAFNSDGDVLWKYDGGYYRSPPAAVNSFLFLPNGDGTLKALY